jgi:hypothetical protein
MENQNTTFQQTNEKKRKLFQKLNSLTSSAENFESLKLYESSLKSFCEAYDLAKSLSKKSTIDENTKKFFSYYDEYIKNKIKILEQLMIVKNNSDKLRNKISSQEQTNQIEVSALSKLNNSSVPQKTNLNINQTPSINKDDILKTINILSKCCETNLKEIDELKKNPNGFNSTLVLDQTTIIQNSYYYPNYGDNIGKMTGHNSYFESSILLEKIEEKFKLIYFKLKKMKNFYEIENNLLEKKSKKQEKLEKLKSSYSAMKKVYENAIRNGVKII